MTCELLAGFAGVLLELLDDLRGRRGILVAPRDAGHAHEDVVQLGAVRRVLEGLLDERVLDDLVLDAGLAEAGAERGRLLDGHPLVIKEDGRGHLVELALDRADERALALAGR